MSRHRARRGSSVLLRRGLLVLLICLLAALLVWGVASGQDRDPGATGSGPTPAAGTPAAPPAAAGEDPPGTAEATDPEATPTPAEAPAPATEPLAAPVVVREGVPESARTVVTSPAEFAAAAEWSDGASVRVADAVQQVSGGTGPGAMAGQPQTVFTLEVRNGAAGPLDLNAVVVQAVYGAGTTQASPLYDGATVDFAGTLEPRATATAVYSFAIPADQLGDVRLSVDVDGHRFPAVFTGAVPTS